MIKDDLILQIRDNQQNYNDLLSKKLALELELDQLEAEYEDEQVDLNSANSEKLEVEKSLLQIETDIERLDLELHRIKGLVETEHRSANKTTDAQTKAIVDSDQRVIDIKKQIIDKNFELKTLKLEKRFQISSVIPVLDEQEVIDGLNESLSREDEIFSKIAEMKTQVLRIEVDIEVCEKMFKTLSLLSKLA